MNQQSLQRQEIIKVLYDQSLIEVLPDHEGDGVVIRGAHPRDNELCGLMSRLQNVVALEFSWGTGIADDGFETLCAAFRRLRRLKLSSLHLTEDGFKNIEQLRELREVDMGVYFPGDAAIRHLSELTRLEQLHMVNWGIDGDDLTAVAQCQDLRELNVSRNPLVDGFSALAGCSKLKTLTAEGCPLNIDGARQLSMLQQLESLLLAGCPIRDQMMQYVCELKALRVLLVSGCPITALSLGALPKLANLERLVWPAYAYDERGLEVFARLPSLRELSFWNEPPLSKQAINQLRKALPICHVENFYGVNG
jgi:hypothetical protein